MASHPYISMLRTLRGNARGCVFTEPLWGIPYNLYLPYVSIYMAALGLVDRQIGLVTSIGWGAQVLAALISGPVVDKLGRRWATFLFDLLCWSVPVLIWAFAQNFTWFATAAIINSGWRITMNSWTCLLVEDSDPAELADIYALIYIGGLLAGFFAPLAALLVQRFSLVPTMRGLYLFAFVMMTAKFVLTFFMTHETDAGRARMRETREQNLFAMLAGMGSVLRQVLRTPETLYTLGIMLVATIGNMLYNTFWAIIATRRIGVPEGSLGLYAVVRALIMMAFFFVVIPRLNRMNFKLPTLAGFVGFTLSHLVLINVPPGQYGLLLFSTVLEACAYAALNPQLDRLVAVTVNPQERARIQSLLYLAVILLTAPFGWVGGVLSSLNRAFPFLLNIALYALGALLVSRAARYHRRAALAPANSG